MEPDDVASGVEHHVDISRRSSDAEAREVLSTSLRETRDDGAAESAGSRRMSGVSSGDPGGECSD